MKWITHQVVTGVATYTATGSFLFAAYSMAGAIVPDWIEGDPLTLHGMKGWHRRHRNWSHWPVVYGAALFALTLAWPDAVRPQVADLRNLLWYGSIGALLHIAEDALCGTVPFLFPSWRVGIKLFKVGSMREYICAIALVMGIFCLGRI